MDAPLDWLLDGEAWVVYRTRLDLLGESPTAAQVIAARTAMLADTQLQTLLHELAGWPGHVIASHKSAGQPFHKLAFLADLGLAAGDPGVGHIIDRILQHQADEGPFQLPATLSVSQGQAGAEVWGWALCDAPLVVYALAHFGMAQERAVRAAMQHLLMLVRDNGWPCAVSKELGKFRGPGRMEDPCPFATLAMLKAIAAFPDLLDSPAAHIGAESLLNLWSESSTRHPYMFFMGTDFRKLKVPFIWYDLIHVLDVLSRFAWLNDDPRLRNMLSHMLSKADDQGRYTLESVWTAWKAWEFGQKQAPSRWLTLAAWRIAQRIEDGANRVAAHA